MLIYRSCCRQRWGELVSTSSRAFSMARPPTTRPSPLPPSARAVAGAGQAGGDFPRVPGRRADAGQAGGDFPGVRGGRA
ncbi:MAG: hypothetical protein Q8N47_08080 [Bryobacterales bacterium]|nr:hypothetical protein [Bryobacterales bacterium]